MQLPLVHRDRDRGGETETERQSFHQYMRLCVYCTKPDRGEKFENPLLTTPAKLRIDDGVLTEYFNFEAEERKLDLRLTRLDEERRHGPTYESLRARRVTLFEEHPLVRLPEIVAYSHALDKR